MINIGKKEEVTVLIPQLYEYVIQPNHVTDARYEYTLLQERIFTGIMYELQRPIEDVIKGKDIEQLNLFNDNFSNQYEVKIVIPLKNLTTASNYKHIFPAAENMMLTPIRFPSKTYLGEDGLAAKPLLKKIVIPVKKNRRYDLEIYLDKEIAQILIDVSTKSPSFPVEYTRFVYQIAQQASSKYTSLLYKKICSWRKKGGFTISLQNLYNDICVGNVYLNKQGQIDYRNFRIKVLEKAKEELYKKADCWFEYSENYQGRNVNSITFKVITRAVEERKNENKENIKFLLKQHFQINNEDIEKHFSLLFSEEYFDSARIMQKLIEIQEAMNEIRIKTKLVDPKAYAMKAVINLMNEIIPKTENQKGGYKKKTENQKKIENVLENLANKFKIT
ncbi:MAG: replication initiation protein [Marinilabiliaceae bacterium]|nr:replication initiation protein [Marinilabiliaceae bacterium]